MNKSITLFLLSLIIVGLMTASAGLFPMIISGQVRFEGELGVGQQVKFSNLDKPGISGEVRTNQNGVYQILLNNLRDSRGRETSDFDRIRLEVCPESLNPDCVKVLEEAIESVPQTVNFDVNVPAPRQTFVCSNGDIVDDPADCPVADPEDPPVDDEDEVDIEVEERVSTNDDKTVASIEAFYGQPIEVVIGDSKLGKFIDDEIDFDGTDYDVKEVIMLSGTILTSIDDEDFGTDPYFTVDAGDIVYKYIFEEEIDLSEISEDDELEIVFLGQRISIIDADRNSITIEKGKEIDLMEGDSITVDGEVLTATTITEKKVLISCEGWGSITLDEDETDDICGIEIKAVDIIEDEDVADRVTLIVGTDVEESIDDGDDYYDDEEWEWIINLPEYIAIVNQEEYDAIDEDYEAITLGQSIVLPEDFLEVRFREVTDSEVTDITMRLRDKDNKDYLHLKGDEDDSFNSGAKDFDELYIDETGIYDEDLVLIGDEVTIGRGDFNVELGSIKIGKLTIELDFSDILYDGLSYLSKDEKYLDYFGIIFRDPENAVEDEGPFRISVPEERPEATITVGEVLEPTVEVPEEEEPIPPIEVDEEDPEVETEDEPDIEVEEKPDKEIIIIPTDEEEKDDKGISFLTALFASLITLVLGIIGAKYYWAKGLMAMLSGKIRAAKTEEAKLKAIKAAIKAAETVLKKDKAGKYE